MSRAFSNCSPSLVQGSALNCFLFISLLWMFSIFGCGKRFKPKKESAGTKNRVKTNSKTSYPKQSHDSRNVKISNDDSNDQVLSGRSPVSADMLKSPMKPQGSDQTIPLVKKDEKLAKGLIVRRQSDYPAMQDEISDSIIASHSSDLPKEKNCSAEEEALMLTQAKKKTRTGNFGQGKKDKHKKDGVLFQTGQRANTKKSQCNSKLYSEHAKENYKRDYVNKTMNLTEETQETQDKK